MLAILSGLLTSGTTSIVPDAGRNGRETEQLYAVRSRFTVPAQTVDATPSSVLIQQCFPRRSDLFDCPRSKPSQGGVPADLTLASDLTFILQRKFGST